MCLYSQCIHTCQECLYIVSFGWHTKNELLLEVTIYFLSFALVGVFFRRWFSGFHFRSHSPVNSHVVVVVFVGCFQCTIYSGCSCSSYFLNLTIYAKISNMQWQWCWWWWCVQSKLFQHSHTISTQPFFEHKRLLSF